VLGRACTSTGVLDSRTPLIPRPSKVPALCWAVPTAARASWTPVVCGVALPLIPRSPRVPSLCLAMPATSRASWTPVVCGVALPIIPRSPRVPSLCWAMPATSRASWTPVVCGVALPLIPKYPRCAGPCLQHHGRPGLPWCVGSRYPSYHGTRVVLGHAYSSTGVLDSRGHTPRESRTPSLCWAMPATSRASWTPVVCRVALPLIPKYPRCAGPCLQHHGRPGLPWCVRSRYPSYHGTRVVLGRAYSSTGVLDSRGVWGCNTPHTTAVQGALVCWAMPATSRASWTPVVFGVALPPRAWPSGTPVVSWLMAAYLAP
jgi:hypothetical protein